MKVEWNPAKAASNKRKYGVSFDEAATCFADPLALHLEDHAHPERLVLIGTSERSRVLFTVFAELADVGGIRIISARKATRHERRRYEEEND
ncbi:MAG: BrnT family toxin [Polyangiaceae bacterium]